MTTDITPYQPPQAAPSKWVDLVTPAAGLAAQIANTDFVPAALRNKPAAVTACILFGDELGIGPMQALAKIDVIEGRPAPKAELARALVQGAGHDIWFEENTSQRCTVVGRRRGKPEETRVTWTMDDAKRAGLDGKQNWRKWPRAMLAARASAELCRLVFPDCLGGITLTAEEIDDDQAPEPATPATLTAVAKPTARTRRLDRAAENPAAVALAAELAKTPATPAVDDLPPLPDELPAADDAALFDEINGTGPKLITEPQTKKMLVLMNKAGMSLKEDRLNLCQTLTGRTGLTTSKDLTMTEASLVIDRLTAVEEGKAELVFEPDGTLTILDIEGAA